jgi:hypothetical protein
MGQCEDDMKVLERQNLILSFLQPPFAWHVLAFGAMAISAGMIGNAHSAAVVAAIDVAAQTSGATVQQIGYDFFMFGPQAVLTLIVAHMLV